MSLLWNNNGINEFLKWKIFLACMRTVAQAHGVLLDPAQSRFWPTSLGAFSASWSSRLLTHNLFKAEDFQRCFYLFSVLPVSQSHLRLNPHIQALLQNDVAASHHIFHFSLSFFFIFAQHVFALAWYPLTQTSQARSVSITLAQNGDDKITGSLKQTICYDWIYYSVLLNKVQRLPRHLLLRLQQ